MMHAGDSLVVGINSYLSYSMFNVTAAFTLPIDIIHHTTPTNISEKIHRSKLNRIDLATLDHGRKSVS